MKSVFVTVHTKNPQDVFIASLYRASIFQKMKRERDDEYIPLSRIKIRTNKDGRIEEDSDIRIHGEVEPRFLHKVWLESTALDNHLTFDESHMNMSIGRSSSCDLQIKVTDVSSSHCYIVLKQCGLYIVDMGSKNGTFINEKRLSCWRHVLLRDKDRINIASQYTFEVKYSSFMQTDTDFGERPGFEFKYGKYGLGYYIQSDNVVEREKIKDIDDSVIAVQKACES